MTAIFKIEQPAVPLPVDQWGKATRDAQTFAAAGSVELTAQDQTHASYTWKILSQPRESMPEIIVAAGANPWEGTADLTHEGGYLVRLIVDIGMITEDVSILYVGIRLATSNLAVPALTETIFDNSQDDPAYRGWEDKVDAFMKWADGFVGGGLDASYHAGQTISLDTADLAITTTGPFSFTLDTSGCTGVNDGFRIEDGTDHFRLLHQGLNLLDLMVTTQETSIAASVKLGLYGVDVEIENLAGVGDIKIGCAIATNQISIGGAGFRNIFIGQTGAAAVVTSAEQITNTISVTDAGAHAITLSAVNAGAGTADVDLYADDDITFDALGSGPIPLNSAAPDNVLVGYTATSIIGALNEALASIIAEDLWDRAGTVLTTHVVGDTIDIDAAGAGITLDSDTASNFTVDGADLTLSTTTSGDVVIDSIDDITFDARGSGAIPFNAAAPDNVLVGYTATSIIGALNEAIAAIVAEDLWDRAGTTLTTHTAGDTIDIDAVGAGITLDSDTASNFTVDGDDLTLSTTTTGNISIDSIQLLDLDAVGAVSINSSGALINIGNVADNQNINIGSAGQRVIQIGNSAATTSVLIDAGPGGDIDLNVDQGGISLTTLTSGNIRVNSAGDMLIDAVDEVEINSTGGVISIGNAADDFDINVGTGGARTITIGNAAVLEVQIDTLLLDANIAAGTMDLSAGSFVVTGDGTNQVIEVSNGSLVAPAILLSGAGRRSVGSGPGTIIFECANPLADAQDVTTEIWANIINGGATGNALLNITSANAGAGTGILNIEAKTTINIGDSGTYNGSINLGTTGARLISVGNATGITAVRIDSGSLGVEIDSALNGWVKIGTDATAIPITIGNAAVLSVDIDAITFSIDATTDSNITVTGSAESLTLAVAGGGVQVLAIDSAGTGLNAIDLNATAGGITLDAASSISLDAVADSNFTMSAGGDGARLTIETLGAGNQGIAISSAGNVATAIAMTATAGGIEVDALLDIAINSSTGSILIGNDAVAKPISIGTGAAARIITVGNAASTEVEVNALLVDINAGATGMTVDSAGAITINSSAGTIGIGNDNINQNISVGTAGVRTIYIGHAAATAVNVGALDILLRSASAAATSISLDAIAGGIVIDAVGQVDINSSGGAINIGDDADAQNINIGTGIAARTIAIGEPTTVLAVNIDAITFSIDATTDSNITVTGDFDLTFGARGGTIDLNAAAPDNVLVGYAATSIVGALNEVMAAVVVADVWLATADEAITIGDAVCGALGTDDRVNQANADSTAAGRQYCVGFAVTGAAGAGNTCDIQSFGLAAVVTCPAAEAWTRGDAIYLDDVGGQVSNVAPVGVGDVVQRVGWAAETNAVGASRKMFIAIGDPTIV